MSSVKRWITLLAVVCALAAGTTAWAASHARPRARVGFGHGYYGYSLGLGLGFGIGYGYYPYWAYAPYGFYPYYGYPYRGYYDASGAVRLQVKPKEARVLVDGYYVGIVDDFDGTFQRLRLPPGRHEITLKLPGFKTHRIRLYAAVANTLKVHYELIPGTGEDEPDEAAVPRDPDRAGVPPAATGGREASRPGAIRMNVRPDDAVVYIDGEFRGAGRQAHRLVLPPGIHRLEVVRPGFQTFEREVEVEAGGTVDVNVELKRS